MASPSGPLRARPPRRPTFDVGAEPAPLRRSAAVLLLVDFINPLRFDGAETLAEPARAAAEATAALKRRLARDGVPTVYANDNYGVWRSDFRELLAACKKLPGVPGRMARTLAPDEQDLQLLKPRHSAFYGTPLELLLSQMHASTLIIAGLSADLCVQITATDAFLRGYKVWVPADCTAAESPERLQSALHFMQQVLKADVRRGDEVGPRARRLPT